MKIKKYLALALTALLTLFTLTACGGGNNSNDNPGNNSNDNPGTEASQPGNQEEQMAAAGIQTPNTETGNTQKTDETVVIQLGGYPDYFWHPGTDGSNPTNEETIISAAFLDRLADYDEVKNEVVPMLAESWEVDGPNFTFHLRSGVKMADGSDLTADDVVYTVNLWKESCASNDTGKYIVDVTKVNDSTVTITFNSAAPTSSRC